LTAVAARQIFVIRADNNKIGKIAIIFIGMAEVSSCVATVKIGDKVRKG
jgi:phosphatidylserine decarboxylase